MGKFDGILLVSDWDGTLCNKNVISDTDIDTINFFKREGGLFTICSGRSPAYLDDYSEDVSPNTYKVGLNGAIILDPDGKKVYENLLDPSGFDLLCSIVSGYDVVSMAVFPDGCDGSTIYKRDEFLKAKEELKKYRYYKLVFFAANEEEAIRIINQVDYNKEIIKIVRSGSKLVEIISTKATKGVALEILKELLAPNKTVAVGDFENDIDLLKAADIGYATENAVASLKLVADYVTNAPCGGAIAEVIRDLER